MAGNRFFCVGEVAAALGGFAEIARLWCRNGDRNYVQTHVPAAVFLVPLGLVIGRCWLDTFRPRAGQITLVAVEFFSKANILRPLVLLMEHNSPSCSIWNHPVQWRLGRRVFGRYLPPLLCERGEVVFHGWSSPSVGLGRFRRHTALADGPADRPRDGHLAAPSPRDWEELKATTAVGDRNVPILYKYVSISVSINIHQKFHQHISQFQL